MSRKSHDDAFGAAGAETIIGAGVKVKGELNSESDIMIDGIFEGTIIASGDVNIGVNAHISATVRGRNVTVAGQLRGNIKDTGEAFIRETGQVEGDITSMGLAINPGGVFVGRSHMQAIPSIESAPEADSRTK